jgi:hypothetical protein
MTELYSFELRGVSPGRLTLATRFRDLSLKENWNLVWPFLSVFGFGSIVRVWASHQQSSFPTWLPRDVVGTLADAIIVAGIIGAALELFATRFLIERVANDLAEKLVGRGLPLELQAHIRKIADTDLVRDHFVKAYRLSAPEGGQIRAEITVSFDAKNYSDSSLDYVPFFQEEAFYNPEVLSVDYGLDGQKRYSDVVREVDPTTKTLTVTGKHKLTLEPIRKNGKCVCTVTIKYSMVMPEQYSDITGFAGATVDASLRIDNIPEGLAFVSGGFDAHHHDSGSTTWYFYRPFVTGQHVRVWWFKKPVDKVD